MSSNRGVQAQVTELLKRSDDAAQAGDLQTALKWVKEAAHLEDNNAAIQDALRALERRERTGDAVALVQRYLATASRTEGERALAALRQKHLPNDDADQLLDLLVHNPTTTPPGDLLDSLTAALIDGNVHVKKRLAATFARPVTELFDQLYERGPQSLKAFATLPLQDAVWTSEHDQASAQRDIFRLSMAKLIDVNIHHPDRLMQLVARQLAIAPRNVSAIIDADSVEIILCSLDIRMDAPLRTQAMLATSKVLESTKEQGEQLFAQFIATRVGKQTIDDLIIAFSASAAVFPMIPVFAARLFLTDGFVQQLVPNLERNSEAGKDGQRKSRTLEVAALELLSAACVDKNCREAIERYCAPWLRDLSEERDGDHRALSALVLAKINASSSEEVTAKLADLVLSNETNKDQAIEGLAYTTLQPKVKEDIASNLELLQSLVAALSERPSAAFGCLTIFSNLTSYRPVQTAEQKKMAQLKAYANSQKPDPIDPFDNDTFVTARSKKLLDADVVPALVASCRQTSSPTNVAMVVKSLLAISREQKHRAKMVQQGAVKVLLQIRERIAKTDKSTAEASSIDRNASHALARLLVSVNPAHVFSSTLPVSTAVSSLIPLLNYDTDSEQRDLLPTFESLLSLTNLASMEDPTARDLIIRTAFDQLENLLFSSNTLVQRASVELICNLMASPSAVSKFADGSNDAKRRLHILLALSDVEDLATRRAAGGALAMLTEWDAAVKAVLDKERGIQLLLGMCAEDNDEMRMRGFACVLNVLGAPGDVGTRGLEAVKSAGAVEIVKTSLKGSRNQEVLGLGVEVLKKLQ